MNCEIERVRRDWNWVPMELEWLSAEIWIDVRMWIKFRIVQYKRGNIELRIERVILDICLYRIGCQDPMDEFTRRLRIRLFCIGLKKAVRDLSRINVGGLRLKRPDLTSEVPRISDGDCWWQAEVLDWILISHRSRDWLNDLKQREILCKLMTEIPRMAGCNGGLQIEFLFWLNRSFRSQDRMGYCRLRSCLDWWLRYHGWQDVMDDYRWKSCFDWWSLMEVGNEWMIVDWERSCSVGWLRVPWMAGCNGWLRMEFLFDWGGHSTRELDFPEELINFRHRSWTSRKNWWTSGTGVGLPGSLTTRVRSDIEVFCLIDW